MNNTIISDKLISDDYLDTPEAYTLKSSLEANRRRNINNSEYGDILYIDKYQINKNGYGYRFSAYPVINGVIRRNTKIFIHLVANSGDEDRNIRIKLNPSKLGIRYLLRLKQHFYSRGVSLYTEHSRINRLDFAFDKLGVNINQCVYYVQHKTAHEIYYNSGSKETYNFGVNTGQNVVCIYNKAKEINSKRNAETITGEYTRIETKLLNQNLSPANLLNIENPFRFINIYSYINESLNISDLDYETYAVMIALNNGAALSDLLYGTIRPSPAIKRKILSTFNNRFRVSWWDPTRLWDSRHEMSPGILYLYHLFGLFDHTAYSDIPRPFVPTRERSLHNIAA